MLKFYLRLTSQVYVWLEILNIYIIFTGFMYNFHQISFPS